MEIGEDFFNHMAEVTRKSPGEVVMVVRRMDGGVLLMTKEFYPPGLYRLPTGKLHGDEAPALAFQRELMEETGFDSSGAQDLGRLTYRFRNGGREVSFTSYIYVIEATQGEPQSSDPEERISGYRWVRLSDLRLIAGQLRRTKPPWDDWGDDWGKFKAVAHDFVADALT